MKTFNIKLETIQDVQDFVKIITAFDFQIDLKSGRYIVNAKSILGIFSLDLTLPIILEAYTMHWDAFAQAIERFEVK